MDVKLEGEFLEKFKAISDEAKLSPERAAQFILEQFVQQPGGRIYAGSWRRGNVDDKKGFRFAIQWPFKSGFTKKKGDEI